MNIMQKNKLKAAKGPLLTPKMKKYLQIGAASLAGFALLVYASIWGYGWIKRNPAPPPESAKPVEVAKYIASDSFNKLPLSQKEEYLQKLRGGAPGQPPQGDPRAAFKDLDQNTRQALFQKGMQVREARENKTAKEYFSLSKEDREKFIASRVADQDKRFAEMRARFGQGRGPGGQQGQGRGQGGGQRGAGGPPGGGGPGGPPPF